MGRFDEETQCEVLTPEEASKLKAECETFEARRAKELNWVVSEVWDLLEAAGLETVFVGNVRTAMGMVRRKQTYERGLVVTMFSPTEIYDALERAMVAL